jgi:hypothetical protein
MALFLPRSIASKTRLPSHAPMDEEEYTPALIRSASGVHVLAFCANLPREFKPCTDKPNLLIEFA